MDPWNKKLSENLHTNFVDQVVAVMFQAYCNSTSPHLFSCLFCLFVSSSSLKKNDYYILSLFFILLFVLPYLCECLSLSNVLIMIKRVKHNFDRCCLKNLWEPSIRQLQCLTWFCFFFSFQILVKSVNIYVFGHVICGLSIIWQLNWGKLLLPSGLPTSLIDLIED